MTNNNPNQEKKSNRISNRKRYLCIGFILLILYCISFVFAYFLKADYSFIILLSQFFLSVCFAGFFGCFLYSRLSEYIKNCEKESIKKHVKTYLDKTNQNNSDSDAISLNIPIKDIIDQISNDDEQSKLLHRKSKKLQKNNNEIQFISGNNIIKTTKLHYIADFFYELIDYSRNTNNENPDDKKQKSKIATIIEARHTIRKIESMLVFKRSLRLILFCFFPTFVFLVCNFLFWYLAEKANISSGIIIHLSRGFLFLASLAIFIIPVGYFFYAGFKWLSILHWRKNISKIEDTIAQFFELVFFFIGAMVIVCCCLMLIQIQKYQISDNDIILIYTLVSAFFPIELFNKDIADQSLLLNKDLPQSFNFIVRLFAIALSTLFSLKIVSLIVNKYRKYSYDEHSYNSFLPPELIKIFGFFTVFIFSSALAYSLVIAEIKNLDNTDLHPCQDPLPNPVVGTSFTFTDFLPYSIFISLIGAGMAIATRDLLDNYFAGIAQRVDAPFEEGDMVTIGDSSIMQVKTIGFKNVSFFNINKNAIRHIPFKKLENQKVVNYTEPTLHYRRTIHLYVSVMNESSEIKKPVTKRAEMLLLLASFYVQGVKTPSMSSISSPKIKEILELIKKERGINYDTFIKDNEINNTEKLFLDKLSNFLDSERTQFNNNKKVENIKIELKKAVIKLEAQLAYIKCFEDPKKALSSDDLKEDNIQNLCDAANKSIKKQEMNGDISIYKEILKSAAELSVDISYRYYQLALLLWDLKEKEGTSKFDKRNIDAASLDLLNAPRVSSKNIIDSSGTARWQMDLEVTLKLAEQSDEVIHHINSFIDKHYQLFIGSHVKSNSTK